MPSRPIVLAPFLAAALLAACSDSGGATAQELGPQATRDYPLSGFDRVELKGLDDVVVHAGTAFAVRAEGPQGVLDRLEITATGGVLRVSRRPDAMDWGGDGKAAKITVTLPTLTGATVAGSGDMTVDRAAGTRFEGAVTGSGSLDIANLEAPAAALSVAGSGDLTAKGKIGTGEYSVAGSGDLRASGLEAETIRTSVAGSGDITARATGSAAVSLVGSGDVTVDGGARCTVSKVGSGDAKCG